MDRLDFGHKFSLMQNIFASVTKNEIVGAPELAFLLPLIILSFCKLNLITHTADYIA
jgi:hypothetical protein